MATYETNKFEDTLVESNGSNALPRDLVITPGMKCIFKGYADPPPGAAFLCDSQKYGTLYATPATQKVHPMIENDALLGGCAVVFVRKEQKENEQEGKLYVVLVQVKGRPYLMNPAGHRDFGETFCECAVRETKEETGLVIENLQPLAEWEFETWFGGLKWNALFKAFYATCKCPEEWELKEPVNRIDFVDDQDEVDYLLVVDVKHLDKSGLTGHHLGLVKEAMEQMGRPLYPYLNSFKFIHQTVQVDFL